MNQVPRCWCGNVNLVSFAPAYLKCPACETLVSSLTPGPEISHVIDDERDFYGRDYWFSHQERELGHPNIVVRSRTDLPERCLFWLRTLLRYKLPPARVLELGSGHGGFVAMLRWAGFDATGLELSPWVVEFARKTFNVPMLLGPVETQPIDPGSLDVVALMDVLEHLPNPVDTIRHCLTLLKPNGILVLQTPRYPEGKSYQEMVSEGDRFLELLKEREHLYLFSQRSILDFFGRLGADHLKFEPPMFPHYDMSLIVSRTALDAYHPTEIAKALCETPSGRTIQALLDLDDQTQDLKNRYAQCEADRSARLESIHRLQKWLGESQEERTAALSAIEDQAKRVATLETERIDLQTQSDRLRSALEAIRASRVYQLIRRLGAWRWLEQVLAQSKTFSECGTMSKANGRNHQPIASDSAGQLARIAVDLTPLLPGGKNGGAKLIAMGVVHHLIRLLPNVEFVLLTSDKGHNEVAVLDAPNVRRLCVSQFHPAQSHSYPVLGQANRLLKKLLVATLPPPVFSRMKSLYRSMGPWRRYKGLVRELEADLLFCPFTAPFFYDPSVPTVSVIFDLQYLCYPYFFASGERSWRDKCFRDACNLANRVVCISEYVRDTVLANSELSPDRVITIHPRLFTHLQEPEIRKVSEVLGRFRLTENQFLLYPANFWPHKNHAMLFTAFGLYRSRHPKSDLKLVCTSAPDQRFEELREAARRMGLETWIVPAAYLPVEELAALLQSCRALVFPSLYEGFGMPILEAMAFGKPVLCSNVTSLPEVAGDAALYFDPRNPQEIARAIERIATDPELVTHLVVRGDERVASFGGPEKMAQQYLSVLREVLSGPRSFPQSLRGIYQDGWTANRVIVSYSAESSQRHLEMRLHAPQWLPHDRLSIRILPNGQAPREVQVLRRGQSLTLRQPLPSASGFVECMIEPTFQPRAFGINDDERALGCLCLACRIISPTATHDLLVRHG